MPMISLQVSAELQKNLDIIQEKLGFSSRSELLRSIILEFLSSHTKDLPILGHQIAVVTAHYEAREDIATKFSAIVQQYDELIKSISQYHLRTRIIKTLLLSGNSRDINDFYREISGDRLYKSTITYLVIPEKSE
ncbi:MAG: hypothetical protein K9W44_16730 [Candidatus Lokiarchaeota archaeon]|nr:hypothetical protein [Candidatus Harpocratesius repetitus]